MVNEHGDAYVDIVNMAVETSLQYMTTLTVSHFLLIYFAQAEEGKSIYFRSGKYEADDSFEVYHINRLREILSRSLQREHMFFDLAQTHSQSRTRQHRFSSESSNGCPL